MKQELKIEQKIVKSLKKKSLWSRILDEVIVHFIQHFEIVNFSMLMVCAVQVIENLVDIVYFIHFEISEVYQNSGVLLIDLLMSKSLFVFFIKSIQWFVFPSSEDVKRKETVKEDGKHQDEKLGSANLALHYASIISQIDTMVTLMFFLCIIWFNLNLFCSYVWCLFSFILDEESHGLMFSQILQVSRSSSILTNTRDMLYEGLPSTVKLGLRSKLQSFKDCENVNT